MRDLGGQVSEQQQILLDNVLTEHLLLKRLDGYLATMPSLVNMRRRAVYTIVKERQSLADDLVKHLAVLGLKRQTAPSTSLEEYLNAQGLTLARAGGNDATHDDNLADAD